jgi:flagellar basal-body rod modification protein FlgD
MAITATQNEISASVLASINGKATTASKAGSSEELSDRFLKLLVTQLKNQDPMNPMENAELTTQLAQMSTVEGVSKLNTSLEGLVSQYKTSQAMQGAALVGRQVMAEGNTLTLNSAGAAGGINLAAAADSLKVKVFDDGGMHIQTLDVGEQPAGLVKFVWDGKNSSGETQAEGNYSFKVEANAKENAVAATSYAIGNVLSVSLNDSDMGVEVSGVGERNLNQIRQIF